MAATFDDMIAGLVIVFQHVAGMKTVLDSEPTAILDTPCAWLMADSGTYERRTPALEEPTHVVKATVAVAWQDTKAAEAMLRALIQSVPAAIRADRTLGGRLRTGKAWLQRYSAGWINAGGTDYRSIEFYIEVWDF